MYYISQTFSETWLGTPVFSNWYDEEAISEHSLCKWKFNAGCIYTASMNHTAYKNTFTMCGYIWIHRYYMAFPEEAGMH